jgi:hypothetical protein
LAQYKRALYFDQTDSVINQKWSTLRNIVTTWRTHYNNIRDPSWPDCRSFKKINQLPAAIKQELLDDPYTQAFVDFEYRSDFQGQEVFLRILPFLESAAVTIRLQDLVNHPERILGQVFEIDQLNDQQKNLIDHWKRLHPTHMLDTLGIIPAQ